MHRQAGIPAERINSSVLRSFFQQISQIDELRVRVHYQGLGESASDDIPPNKGEALLTSLLADVRALAVQPVFFSLIYSDPITDTTIWEIGADAPGARLLANLLLSQPALLFCSLLEVVLWSNNKKHSFVLGGIRYHFASLDAFLIEPPFVDAAVRPQSRIKEPPEKMEQFLTVLKDLDK